MPYTGGTQRREQAGQASAEAPWELNLERGAVLQSGELWEHLGNLAFGRCGRLLLMDHNAG